MSRDREFIPPTKRKSMTKARIARIFLENQGRCHLCELLIRDGEKYEIDHITPLWAGGSEEDNYLAPAHVKCHAAKTAAEAPARAKRNRIIAKGYAKPRKPPSKWKRRMDGSVVDRATGIPIRSGR